MTLEEENKLQERLGEATDIREQINICNDAIKHIDEDVLVLNASTFGREYESIGKALSLVQDDVVKLLTDHISELEEKYKRL